MPDLDLVVTGHDVYDLQRDKTVVIQGAVARIVEMPIFCIAKRKQDAGMILMPDWYAMRDWQPDKSQILGGSRSCPWNLKIPLLFFRGGDSGAFDRMNWRNSSRIKLVSLSFERPDLIDARLTYTLKYEEDPTIRDIIKREGMIVQHVPLQTFLHYRYIMDVDGHTANTPRVALWLHSNSLMVKQTSDDVLCFFWVLKPYVHFIPVKNDLSDLVSQLEWAKAHDEECERIAKNGNRFAKEFLSPEGVYLYLYRLLKAYSQMQKKEYFK